MPRICWTFLLLLVADFAQARPAYLDRIPNSQVNGCGTCHFNVNGGGRRNRFGSDAQRNNFNWAILFSLDSDGDGATNGVELGDPRGQWRRGQRNPGGYQSHPGDAASRPEAPRDAGVPPADAGRPPRDSGVIRPPRDSGVVRPPRDSGVVRPPRDTGLATPDSSDLVPQDDAGGVSGADTGLEIDSGVEADAGVEVDAGVEADAGALVDAGAFDAGASTQDAGGLEPSPPGDSGCSCQGFGPGALSPLLFALVALRRRKASRS